MGTFWIIFLFTAWVLRTTRSILFQVNFWQVKEYRWDRIWAEIQSPKGKDLVFNWLNLGKWFLVVVFWLLAKDPVLVFSFGFLVLGLWLGETFLFFQEIEDFSFKRPRLTLKAFLIGGLCFGGVLGLAWFLKDWTWPWALLIADRAVPLGVSLFVFLLKPVTFLVKQRAIREATLKRRIFRNLKVIGITGSFGKTSTKEFLATILERKFKVLKTPQNINTDIGIAQVILKHLSEDTEIFVCELAAYKRDEIKKICKMVKPQIGILTGITSQHLALFGSLANLKKAKGELFECLPAKGVAIFNGDSPGCREIAQSFKGKKFFYSLNQASQIRVKKNGVSFVFEKVKFEVPLLGKANVLNLLGAIKGAQILGMSLPEIKKSLQKIKPLPRTMAATRGIKGAVIIDDSYSANPEGVKTALEFLGQYPAKKKVVIMPCLIELGQEAEKVHEEIGRRLAEVANLTIITTLDYATSIKRGFQHVPTPRGQIIIEKNPQKAIQKVTSFINPGDVVLIAGRVSGEIAEKLKVQN